MASPRAPIFKRLTDEIQPYWIRTRVTLDGVQLWRHATIEEQMNAVALDIPVHIEYLDREFAS